MNALPPERVTYGDKEIARILKRASELQRAAPTRPDPSGLTVTELEGSWLDVDWLLAQPEANGDPAVHHIVLEEPIAVLIDGRRGAAVIKKPGV